MHRYLALLLMTMALTSIGSNAQTPPAIEGPVYIATYLELVPTAVNDGGTLLKQYRDASRKDAGNLRMELVQEVGRPSRFAILAIWVDQKAYDAHVMAGHTRQFRDKLGPMSGALYDERLYKAFD